MATSMQFGGWYPNPSAGGQVQRYWGNWGWTSGNDPTGGRGNISADAIKALSSPQQSQSTSSTPSAPATPQNTAQALIDTVAQTQAKANKAFTDYKSSNPFNYDQVLAQKTTEAKQQLDPYYNETLSNYLLGATRKVQNSASDTRDLLSELSSQTQSNNRDTQLKLDAAVKQAGQGFADAGLFDSGARLSTEGQATADASNNISDFNRGQDYRATGAINANNRTIGDYGTGNFSADNPTAPIPGLIASQDIRNQARDQSTNTSTLASKLTGEAGQQYVSGFQQTLPPELQSNNNFDLLKQIGVYS